jgi:tRNA nucleotidyltransferase (CCA-adding enzyme)
VELGGLHVDLTRTRRETYEHPGALPDVEPAPIGEDLRRRDFTVNAMALDLRAPHELLDPYDGAADVAAGALRTLHDQSFVDDPTRALRAARYCARLGLAPEPRTLELLRDTDLDTVSADRRDAELARLAGEPAAPAGFRLLAEWGLLALDESALRLIEAVAAVAAETPWPDERAAAILLVASGGEPLDSALRLSRTEVDRPSEGVKLGRGHSRAELLVATAAGCEWLAEYANEWSAVSLEIDGEDLLAAGVPQGPAIGAALRETLERKLDGGLHGGREAELEVALAFARRAG